MDLARMNQMLAQQPKAGIATEVVWMDDMISFESSRGRNIDPRIKNLRSFMVGENASGVALTSDTSTDHQIIVEVYFKDSVNLTSINLRANQKPINSEASAPRLVKLWVNQTVDFEDASDMDGDFNFDFEDNEIELGELAEGYQMKIPKHVFRNVHNLSMFIEENAEDSDCTFLNMIRFAGYPHSTMNMNDLKPCKS